MSQEKRGECSQLGHVFRASVCCGSSRSSHLRISAPELHGLGAEMVDEGVEATAETSLFEPQIGSSTSSSSRGEEHTETLHKIHKELFQNCRSELPSPGVAELSTSRSKVFRSGWCLGKAANTCRQQKLHRNLKTTLLTKQRTFFPPVSLGGRGRALSEHQVGGRRSSSDELFADFARNK